MALAALVASRLTAQTSVSYPVGTGPIGVVFDGTNIWAANYIGGTVTKLLASTGATMGTYPVAAGPSGVVFDGANIWVSNNSGNTVTKLLASTGAAVGTYPVGSNPEGVAFDGKNIWVASYTGYTVTVTVQHLKKPDRRKSEESCIWAWPFETKPGKLDV